MLDEFGTAASAFGLAAGLVWIGLLVYEGVTLLGLWTLVSMLRRRVREARRRR